MDDSGRGAYLAGLRMLARRELSERQVRDRLRRREYPADAIDAAVARLKEGRALDDERCARSLARYEIAIRGHGRMRAQRQLETAGIPRGLAQSALDEVMEGVDPDAMLDAALERRLRGATQIEDDAQFRRLYRFLVTQGFARDRVMRALVARRR